MPTSPITQVKEYAAAVRGGAQPSCLMVRKAKIDLDKNLHPEKYFKTTTR